jgi:hypothetical protein
MDKDKKLIFRSPPSNREVGMCDKVPEKSPEKKSPEKKKKQYEITEIQRIIRKSTIKNPTTLCS